MTGHRSLERHIAEVFELTAPQREPDPLLERVLSTTGRMRPRSRWLTLLREPPMHFRASVSFGSPTLRLSAMLGVALALLLAVAGLVFAGASLQVDPIVEQIAVPSCSMLADQLDDVRFTARAVGARTR